MLFAISIAGRDSSQQVTTTEAKEELDSIGLASRAKETLKNFLEAETPEQKLRYVLPAEGIGERVQTYYSDGIAEGDAGLMAEDFRFDPGIVSSQDEDRNITALAQSSSIRSLQPMIVFFKDDLLDFDTYTQVKDGTLRDFLTGISSVDEGVYRILLVQDESLGTDAEGRLSLFVSDLMGLTGSKVEIAKNQEFEETIRQKLTEGVAETAIARLKRSYDSRGSRVFVLTDLHQWGLTNELEEGSAPDVIHVGISHTGDAF